jgi:hypothetical protein
MINHASHAGAKAGKRSAKSTNRTPAQDLEERRQVQRPLPDLVVVEGSTESDWALWEESVRLLEIQMMFRKRRLSRLAQTSEAMKPQANRSH